MVSNNFYDYLFFVCKIQLCRKVSKIDEYSGQLRAFLLDELRLEWCLESSDYYFLSPILLVGEG